MTHNDHDGLQIAIKDLLSRRFTEIEIVSVSIAQDVCEDDEDDGVEITVVFKGTTEQLVRGRPSGMFEMVRGSLKKLGSGAFPVFNFVAAA